MAIKVVLMRTVTFVFILAMLPSFCFAQTEPPARKKIGLVFLSIMTWVYATVSWCSHKDCFKVRCSR